MATQNVDFTTLLDSGENDKDAVQPIQNGERGNAATFNRPVEALRVRTERLREEIKNLKYLADADRALLLSATNPVRWTGVYDSEEPETATGRIDFGELEGTLELKPFLAPAVSLPAKVELLGVRFTTYGVMPAPYQAERPPRAYSGANEISVELSGASGQVLSVLITGSPEDNVRIAFNNHATMGTRRQDLIDRVNTDDGCKQLGLKAELVPGFEATEVLTDSALLRGTLTGALDAETHKVTSATLANFFSVPANRLLEGDVLCVWYEALVMESDGGRRQSIPDLPEQSTDIPVGSLFLLRAHPERASLALPLARVQNGNLHFVNGAMLAPAQLGDINLPVANPGSAVPQEIPLGTPRVELVEVPDGDGGTITEEQVVGMDGGQVGASPKYAHEDHVHVLGLESVRTENLRPGIIKNAHIAADAAIAVSKIANSPDYPAQVVDGSFEGDTRGSAANLARADHRHSHGPLAGGVLHKAAQNQEVDGEGFFVPEDHNLIHNILATTPYKETFQKSYQGNRNDQNWPGLPSGFRHLAAGTVTPWGTLGEYSSYWYTHQQDLGKLVPSNLDLSGNSVAAVAYDVNLPAWGQVRVEFHADLIVDDHFYIVLGEFKTAADFEVHYDQFRDYSQRDSGYVTPMLPPGHHTLYFVMKTATLGSTTGRDVHLKSVEVEYPGLNGIYEDFQFADGATLLRQALSTEVASGADPQTAIQLAPTSLGLRQLTNINSDSTAELEMLHPGICRLSSNTTGLSGSIAGITSDDYYLLAPGQDDCAAITLSARLKTLQGPTDARVFHMRLAGAAEDFPHWAEIAIYSGGVVKAHVHNRYGDTDTTIATLADIGTKFHRFEIRFDGNVHFYVDGHKKLSLYSIVGHGNGVPYDQAYNVLLMLEEDENPGSQWYVDVDYLRFDMTVAAGVYR